MRSFVCAEFLNTMNKSKVISALKTALKIAIAVVILYFVYSKMDTQDMWTKVRSSNFLFLFLGLVLFTASKVVASFRLTRLLVPCGITITEKENLKLYWLGMYYNLFLPGGIGGDGYKIYVLNKRFQVKTKRIVSALFLDRINGVFSLGIMICVMGYFVDFPEELPIKALLIIALPLGILFAYFFVKKLFNDFLKVFFNVLGHSLLVQLLQVASVIFILLSLGVEDHFTIYLLLFLISSIVSIVPITPGGAGLRELTFTFGATLFPIDAEVAVVTGSLFFFITALVSLVGVYYHFNQGKMLD